MNPLLQAAIVLAILVVLLSLAAGLIWLERRLLALWQDRYGPNRVGPFGLLQVLADMIKIFFKEDWIPPFADRGVFVLAPAIIVVTVLLAFAVVPFAPGVQIFETNVALLYFLGLSSLGVYSIVLAGWASNNKYSLLGGMRAASQMISYEVFMGLSLMGVVILAGSFSLRDIVEAQRRMWFVVPQFLGFVLFLIAGVAETRRLPFDLPEAESELVAGFHSEYSGMKFGMFFVGEYLGVTLDFLPDHGAVFRRLAGAGIATAGLVCVENAVLYFLLYSVACRTAASPVRPVDGLGLEVDATAQPTESGGNGCGGSGAGKVGGRCGAFCEPSGWSFCTCSARGSRCSIPTRSRIWPRATAGGSF